MSINYAILQNTPKSYEYKLCDTKKNTPTSYEYKL
jgi:hypothetical protein